MIQSIDKGLIGKELTLSITDLENIDAFEWNFDQVALLEKQQGRLSLTIEPLLSGFYTIKYSATTSDGENHQYVKDIEIFSDLSLIEDKIEEEKEAEDILDPYQEVVIEKSKANTYKLPHHVKRNARYRGTRESEKVLNSNYEQLYDIRQIHDDISKNTSILDKTINMWFKGRKAENVNKREIAEEKVYQATIEKVKYLLNSSEHISGFTNIVVKLDNEIIDESFYSIEGHYLLFDIRELNLGKDTGTLYVSYSATEVTINDDSIGLEKIHQKLANLHYKTNEAERKCTDYENAYK
ncbi:hypothetical protein [Virgibacillus salexigens]|uniref:Uncharacterized protein n=1 Tax=Virgibacillus massiliensis TaxID=1462526 RepID=A0A024QIJ9_9BACI|nr:hypothetical protein [Virgibacillus massiliensis]CDQ41786.1 hypothetical protein BN990_04163 [Virgibacillus massiliensis]